MIAKHRIIAPGQGKQGKGEARRDERDLARPQTGLNRENWRTEGKGNGGRAAQL